MWQSLRYRHWRPALVAALLIVLLATVTVVDPLRATAARFLSVFRVQKFAVVQVPGGQADRLHSFEEQVFGKPEITKTAPETVESVEQASQKVGFPVLAPTYLPEGAQTRTKFEVQGKRTAHSQANLAVARGLLQAAGIDPAGLPEGRDSIPISADIPAGVMMQYGTEPGGLVIMQSPSPKVDVPDDVDMARVGELGLRLLGLPAEKAQEMSKKIDWATTLVVPVPEDVGEVQEVPVRGGTGYVMSENKGSRGDHSVVFWESNGILYAVAGQMRPVELVQVAESLK